jgi:competence protein ComEC
MATGGGPRAHRSRRGLSNTGAWLGASFGAWVAGLALQLQQAALWPVVQYEALGFGAVLALLAGWRFPRVRVLAVAGACALAFGWAGWRAEQRLSHALPSSLEGENLVVTGVVAALPQASPSGTRFLFEVESASLIEGQAVELPPMLALGWYRNWHDESALADPRLELRAGQRWRLPLRLKRPHGGLNPGGFDYELWLFEQGVRATGYVRSTAALPAQRLDDAAGYPLERLRQRVRDAIFQRVADPRVAGVLAALSIGDQGAIEHDDWDLFRDTGIAHLVSISGLHVTMFAWLAGGVVGWAWRRSALLSLWCPAPWAARWGGVLAAAGYALLSGWGVPSQRTVWMLATAAALSTAGLAWPWLLVLMASAAVVTLLDPWALLQVGFWLSFMAVALLMSSSPAHGPAVDEPAVSGKSRRMLRAMWSSVHEGVRTQVIATLGLAPLTLVFFQQLSIVGFAANLVAIPLVTLVITPLALLGVFVAPLWQLGALAVQAMVKVLTLLVGVPGAVWTVPPAAWWAQLAGLAAGALLLMPLPWRLRLLAVPMAMPLLWPAVPVPPTGRFELLAADVGQGTSVLVRTHSHVLLYDTGPQYSPESDAGQRVLLPLLRQYGNAPVDLLMLSHSDTDHTGGAASVMSHWPVRAMSSSLGASHPLISRGVPHTPCSAGQRWQWDGVRFSVLHPLAQALHWPEGARPPKPNHLSCVLRIEDSDGRSALLTGDAEVPQENEMLRDPSTPLKSEILLVPHHGSRTSSSGAFLDAVAPRVAIVQAGYRSRFGHPAPDVMARYEQRGIEVMRSDRCGAWHWSADGSYCERDAARRYWHFVAP